MLGRLISALFLVSYAAALQGADFAFAVIKPATVEAAKNPIAEHGAQHGFYASSQRSYKIMVNGRFRTLKTSAGDFRSREKELLFLDCDQPAAEGPIVDVVEQVEVVVAEVIADPIETEAGVVQNVLDTVREAYDQYISPYVGSTIETVNSAARDALAWIGSIWGQKTSKLQQTVLSRLAVLKTDQETGQTLIINAASVEVKVVRVGQVVFETSSAAVAEQEVDHVKLAVSQFVFEAGDIVVVGGKSWWESAPLEEVLLALSTNAKLAAKADAIVKLVPKTTDEARFTLALFE